MVRDGTVVEVEDGGILVVVVEGAFGEDEFLAAAEPAPLDHLDVVPGDEGIEVEPFRSVAVRLAGGLRLRVLTGHLADVRLRGLADFRWDVGEVGVALRAVLRSGPLVGGCADDLHDARGVVDREVHLHLVIGKQRVQGAEKVADKRGRLFVVRKADLVVEVVAVRGVRDDGVVEPLVPHVPANLLHRLLAERLLRIRSIGVRRAFRIKVDDDVLAPLDVGIGGGGLRGHDELVPLRP